ncbi:hypothetical protein FGF1_16350 [Flavobacteriaceae bacterium GF1]
MEIEEGQQILKSKKKKDKARDRLDAKGMDTLFRTLSRNHYTLLRMVDTKAAIILTVNSILITVSYGAINHVEGVGKENIGIFISSLVYFCLISMIIALVGMLPHKYVGKTYKQSGYQGNLYAGNFADKSLPEFQSQFKNITKNGETVFDELTTDIYFLGLAVKRKQTMIKLAVIALILGLIWSVIYTSIVTKI